MSRPKAPAALRAEAIALVRRGGTYRDVAAQLGVSASSVRNWVRASDDGPSDAEAVAASVADRAAAIVAPATEDSLGVDLALAESSAEDLLSNCRRRLAKLDRAADSAMTAGNTALAARLSRDANDLAKVVKSLESEGQDDRDVLRLSRRDIDEAMAGVRDRFAALAKRPILCENCQRELAIVQASNRSES